MDGNLISYGDNLEALKALLPVYAEGAHLDTCQREWGEGRVQKDLGTDAALTDGKKFLK